MPKSDKAPVSFSRKDTGNESRLRKMRTTHHGKLIAIALSDIHLSHKPPIWRSNEPNWYAAMARQLEELKELIGQLYVMDVICAGDVFDKWNAPAELINFAIYNLPRMLSIPGQHDIPNHSYWNMGQSAYTTLVHSKTIKEATQQPTTLSWGCQIRGFGWETFPNPDNQEEFDGITMAHRYVWQKGSSYPEADQKDNVMAVAKQYDSKLCIFGDNHKGFYNKKFNVFNCGGFFRRNKDQVDYNPMVGLIYENLKIIPYMMDISEEHHLEDKEAIEAVTNLQSMHRLMRELKSLESSDIDFKEAIRHFIKVQAVRAEVAELLIRTIEDEE